MADAKTQLERIHKKLKLKQAYSILPYTIVYHTIGYYIVVYYTIVHYTIVYYSILYYTNYTIVYYGPSLNRSVALYERSTVTLRRIILLYYDVTCIVTL